jgi:hypothetical protein
MICTFVVIACAAAPAPAARLAAPGLSAVNIDAAEIAFLSDHLAQQVQQAAHGSLEVMTSSALATLLGMERQRQLLGCAGESASCSAELAGALGVEGILTGSIGRFGETLQVNLKVVAARDGGSMALFTGTARTKEELLRLLTRGAQSLTSEVLAHLAGTENGASAWPLRRMAWVPLAVGVVLSGVGAYGLARAKIDFDTLSGARTPQGDFLSFAAAKDLQHDGQLFQPLGIAMVATGVACLATAVGFFAWKPDARQEVSVTLVVGDRSVGLAGVFP